MSWQESSVVKRLKCHTPAALHTWIMILVCCVARLRVAFCTRARAHVHDKDARVVDETRRETEGRVRGVVRVGGGGEVLSSDVINALARLELSRVEAGVIPANCA